VIILFKIHPALSASPQNALKAEYNRKSYAEHVISYKYSHYLLTANTVWYCCNNNKQSKNNLKRKKKRNERNEGSWFCRKPKEEREHGCTGAAGA
jgi:hypothetical protein